MSGCCESCKESKPCCESEGSDLEAMASAIAALPVTPTQLLEDCGALVLGSSEDAWEALGKADSFVRPERLHDGGSVPLTHRLAIRHSETTASQPVELGRCSAGEVSVVVFGFVALSYVEAILEACIDGHNYWRVSSTILNRAGAARFRFRGIAGPLVRLYLTAAGTQNGVALVETRISGARLSP